MNYMNQNRLPMIGMSPGMPQAQGFQYGDMGGNPLPNGGPIRSPVQASFGNMPVDPQAMQQTQFAQRMANPQAMNQSLMQQAAQGVGQTPQMGFNPMTMAMMGMGMMNQRPQAPMGNPLAGLNAGYMNRWRR